MADFMVAYNRTKPFEGGYANNSDDPGGETNMGITWATARAFGYMGPMRDLPEVTARQIYFKEYWNSIHLGEFSDQGLADVVYDCGVNCGLGTAGRILQNVLNVLNNRQKYWDDLKVDGAIGPKTVMTANAACVKYREDVINLFQVERGHYHVQICQNIEKSEQFMLSWLRRLKIKVESK